MPNRSRENARRWAQPTLRLSIFKAIYMSMLGGIITLVLRASRP